MITIINPSAGAPAATAAAATATEGTADAKDAQSQAGFALVFAEQMAAGPSPKGKTAAPAQTGAEAQEKPARDDDKGTAPGTALDPTLAAALAALSPPNERTPGKGVAAEAAGTTRPAQHANDTIAGVASSDKRSGTPGLPQAAEPVAKVPIEAQGASTAMLAADRATKDELARPEAANQQATPSAAAAGTAVPGLELPRSAAPQQIEVPRIQVQEPFSSPHWGEAVASRVAVLVRERVSEAEIAINPPDLGPVRAQIRIEDGTATVSLSAAAPETRAALESSLPDLRAQLSADGIQLGDASVSSGPFTRGDSPGAQARPASSDGPAAAAAAPSDPSTGASSRPAAELSLVDLYA